MEGAAFSVLLIGFLGGNNDSMFFAAGHLYRLVRRALELGHVSNVPRPTIGIVLNRPAVAAGHDDGQT